MLKIRTLTLVLCVLCVVNGWKVFPLPDAPAVSFAQATNVEPVVVSSPTRTETIVPHNDLLPPKVILIFGFFILQTI